MPANETVLNAVEGKDRHFRLSDDFHVHTVVYSCICTYTYIMYIHINREIRKKFQLCFSKCVDTTLLSNASAVFGSQHFHEQQ